jgi:cysteinyl-tRNA synthetase
MDDDFNTSVAIAELQRMKSDVNKLLSQGLSTEARKIAREGFHLLGNCLGLFQLDRWEFNSSQKMVHEAVGVSVGKSVVIGIGEAVTRPTEGQMTDAEIDAKLVERNEARKQKDFKKADEIRQFFKSHGIVIEDKPDGTSRWKR